MKKLLGKYLKIGIGILIPFALLFWVLNLLYGTLNNLVIMVLPDSISYEWWFVFPLVIGVLFALILIGFIFSHFKPLKWLLKKIERLGIGKIPVVNQVYTFGKEIVDRFITDAKGDGEKVVVEVIWGGQKTLALLSNEKNKVVFIPTAPNPVNGFLTKVDEYRITDLTFVDLLKMLGSLGNINGGKWE